MNDRTWWQIGALDSLRGFAILGVLVVHSASFGAMPANAYLQSLILSGQRGVQLFFVVSAFTLFLSWENRSQERSPLRNFFLRRVIRLSPMFYLSLVAGILLHKGTIGTHAQALMAALFVNNFTPLGAINTAPGAWSIGTEAAFYIFLPFAFRYVRDVRSAAALVLLGVVSREIAKHVVPPSPNVAYQYVTFTSFFPANLAVFAFGLTLYFLWRDHLRSLQKQQARWWSAAVLLITLALALETPPASVDALTGGALLCALFALALLLYPWKFFVNRATVLLGQVSYSFYLIHFYVGDLVSAVLHGWLHTQGVHLAASVQFLLAIVGVGGLTLLAAYLSWRYIEVPAIRLGKILIGHLEKRGRASTFASEQF